VSLESELRQASDRLMADLARLAELESAKRQATPGTPEFVALARQVESLAAQLLGTSRRQSDLASTTQTVSDAGIVDAPLTPIEDVPASREPHAVLSEWREAERRLAELDGASADAATLRADVERLRDEYRRSFEARR